MDKVEELSLNCIIILEKLIELYKNSQISKDEFISNSKLKSVFLINNINNIADQELKYNIYKILISYASCFSNERENSTYNIPK